MPPAKNYNAKYNSFGRSFSLNETAMSARVYHPATNLLPPSPPTSPTGAAPLFGTRSQGANWSRQNSQNGGKRS